MYSADRLTAIGLVWIIHSLCTHSLRSYYADDAVEDPEYENVDKRASASSDIPSYYADDVAGAE